jgi:N-hydroxyarylamine O-acetyltransferase
MEPTAHGTIDVDGYLTRLGLERRPEVTIDGLRRLMDVHLRSIPFENLDVYFQRGIGVDPTAAARKIVEGGRGGWCFELNGAFALLLAELGFDVRLLGAAVLLDGPNRTVDHMTLEVTLEQPYLVDVGFGDGFIRPLPLNSTDDLDGGCGRFRFMPSPEGTTLVRLTETVGEAAEPEGEAGTGSAFGLEPQYRFRRVALSVDDFAPASERLYSDTESAFRSRPMVTRLLDRGADRVTLLADELRVTVDGHRRTTTVSETAWLQALRQWFGIDPTTI